VTPDKTLPPSLTILETTYSNFVIARALYTFAKLGLADHFGENALSSEELASTANVAPKALYRFFAR
jgi:hypothetical protein